MQPEIPRAVALADIDLTRDHPCVFHDEAEIERGRQNVAETHWGAALLEELRETLTEWPFVELSADEIRRVAPQPDPDGRLFVGFPFRSFETFRNGNLCPIDGTQLDFAGFDQPGQVVCQEGHELPGTHDGVEIDDDGAGWDLPADVPEHWAVAAADADLTGTTFWFVAYYNGWFVKHAEYALEPLGYAAALTEEDRYARTAATLLDIIAEAHRTHHRLVGRREPNAQSRLIRPGYQVARALKDYANAADLVWDHEAMHAESAVNPGASVQERVAEELVIDAADYIWQHMDNYTRIFHNGTGDYNEGLLAAASLLGLDVGYAEWSLDGQVSLDRFLTNTVFRDGQYYETAEMYSVSFAEWVELAYHLTNERYPEGVDYYDDPRFVDLNVTGPDRFAVAGRLPQYGDTAWPDTAVTEAPYAGHFEEVLRVYARTSDEATRRQCARRLTALAKGDPESKLAARSVSPSNPNADLWPLFNLAGAIDPDAADASSPGEQSGRGSELLEGKGFAMLRPAAGSDRGGMLRYGPTLSHGHCDELGLHLYGAGRDLTYDPGHKPKRHFLKSFQRQTVTHQTVTVDETSQVPPADPGGSIAFFGTEPGLTAVEASNPAAYAHADVEEYRRTLAYVDVDAETSYVFDVFRVAGEDLETVDYSFHGQGTGFESSLDFSAPADGSVASADYDWGSQQRPSGEIIGFEEKDYGFNAPPGNGYGFLGNPRRATGDDTWQATWTVEREGPPAAIRLTMLGAEDREVIGADAPDLLVSALDRDPDEQTLPYVLARDEQDTAQYVSVIEPTDGTFPVDEVRELSVTDEPSTRFDPVAVAVDLVDGRTDYFLSVRDEGEITASFEEGHLTTDAGFAMVRVGPDGVHRAHLEAGDTLTGEVAGEVVEVAPDAGPVHGQITELDRAAGTVTVDAPLPTDGSLTGRYLFVEATEYSHNSPYRIAEIESVAGDHSRVHLERGDATLARGLLETRDGDTLVSAADFPMAWTRAYYVEGDEGNDYFEGKRVVGIESGATARVTGVQESYRHVEVTDASDFREGEPFEIQDMTVGDHVRLPSSGSIVDE